MNSQRTAYGAPPTGIKRAAASLLLCLSLQLAAPLSGLACPCAEVPKPPETVATDRKAGMQFTYTQQYKREFAAAISEGRAAALTNINVPFRAIVADIDETLLDNREEMLRHPNFTWPEFNIWIEESRAPLLRPTGDFLAWARKRGYAVFLITGRQENLRRATIENLVRHNFGYDGLYMRPIGDTRRAEDLKTAYRAEIEQMGFKIIVNIGDQWSDLYGGHSVTCVKLPNRIYFIP